MVTRSACAPSSPRVGSLRRRGVDHRLFISDRAYPAHGPRPTGTSLSRRCRSTRDRRVRDERKDLEHRVSLLLADNLDPDLLDDLARSMLTIPHPRRTIFAHPEEVTRGVFSSPAAAFTQNPFRRCKTLDPTRPRLVRSYAQASSQIPLCLNAREILTYSPGMPTVLQEPIPRNYMNSCTQCRNGIGPLHSPSAGTHRHLPYILIISLPASMLHSFHDIASICTLLKMREDNTRQSGRRGMRLVGARAVSGQLTDGTVWVRVSWHKINYFVRVP